MKNEVRTYTIVSKSLGKSLLICQADQTRGNATLNRYHGKEGHSFWLKHNGPRVMIISARSNQAVTVQNSSFVNGTAIIEKEETQEQGQWFRLQEVSPGSHEFVIFTFCGKVLDCGGKSKSNGAKVVQWDFNGGDHQKWNIKRI